MQLPRSGPSGRAGRGAARALRPGCPTFRSDSSRASSRPSVGGVAERREEQRHVMVLRRVAHLENDLDQRVEPVDAAGREVRGGAEREAVGAGRRIAREEVAGPSVPVGLRAAERPPSVAHPDVEPDRDALRGTAAGRVEDVGRNASAHSSTFGRLAGDGREELLQPKPRDLTLLLRGDGELGLRVVGEPPPGDREHLVRGPSRGAHDEDVAEPRLVVAIRGGEARERFGGCPVRSLLLFPGPAARKRRPGVDRRPDLRVRGERFEPVGPREAAPDPVGSLREILLILEGARGGHAPRPLRRAAAGEESGFGFPPRKRVEAFERGRHPATTPKSRSRATPPSGKMVNRACVAGGPSGERASKRWSSWARSGVCGRISRQRASGASGSSASVTSTEQLPGAFPLKWVVSTSIRRIAPGAARRTTAQSWPGPRRRRVSHPSCIPSGGPGRIRLCRAPKNMSLAATTSAPFSSAARSTSAPARSRAGSGATAP